MTCPLRPTSASPKNASTPLWWGLVACLLGSCASTTDPGPSNSQAISFTAQVKPLLEHSCLACHNGSTAAGDLDLRKRDLALRPSPNGPFIVPGYPDRSKIYRVVKLADREPGAMPPTGHALEPAEIDILKRWIAEGATWPSGPEGDLVPPTDMDWRSR